MMYNIKKVKYEEEYIEQFKRFGDGINIKISEEVIKKLEEE